MTAKGHAEVSTFALDVHWASGRTGDAALEEHIAGCSRCQAYLAHLEELSPAAQIVLPREPVAPPRALPLRARRLRTWAVAASGLALAAGIALVVHTRSVEPGYVGTKGTPGVELLVHRGHDTWVWDGRTPLHPGDALALRVACEGLLHVTVAAPGPAGWVRLSDSGCPAASEPLPFTLVVDAEPGDEKLAVVLSSRPVDGDALRRAIDGQMRTADLWTVPFVLPKATEANR